MANSSFQEVPESPADTPADTPKEVANYRYS